MRGRKPFAKEPTLDYEVMSDEEWEEEPEGESLSVRGTNLLTPYNRLIYILRARLTDC